MVDPQKAMTHDVYVRSVVKLLEHAHASMRSATNSKDAEHVHKQLKLVDGSKGKAVDRTMQLRKALGNDDESYLSTGISLVWAASEDDSEYMDLYPASDASSSRVGPAPLLLQSIDQQYASQAQEAAAIINKYSNVVVTLLSIKQVAKHVLYNIKRRANPTHAATNKLKMALDLVVSHTGASSETTQALTAYLHYATNDVSVEGIADILLLRVVADSLNELFAGHGAPGNATQASSFMQVFESLVKTVPITAAEHARATQEALEMHEVVVPYPESAPSDKMKNLCTRVVEHPKMPAIPSVSRQTPQTGPWSHKLHPNGTLRVPNTWHLSGGVNRFGQDTNPYLVVDEGGDPSPQLYDPNDPTLPAFFRFREYARLNDAELHFKTALTPFYESQWRENASGRPEIVHDTSSWLLRHGLGLDTASDHAALASVIDSMKGTDADVDQPSGKALWVTIMKDSFLCNHRAVNIDKLPVDKAKHQAHARSMYVRACVLLGAAACDVVGDMHRESLLQHFHLSLAARRPLADTAKNDQLEHTPDSSSYIKAIQHIEKQVNGQFRSSVSCFHEKRGSGESTPRNTRGPLLTGAHWVPGSFSANKPTGVERLLCEAFVASELGRDDSPILQYLLDTREDQQLKNTDFRGPKAGGDDNAGLASALRACSAVATLQKMHTLRSGNHLEEVTNLYLSAKTVIQDPMWSEFVMVQLVALKSGSGTYPQDTELQALLNPFGYQSEDLQSELNKYAEANGQGTNAFRWIAVHVPPYAANAHEAIVKGLTNLLGTQYLDIENAKIALYSKDVPNSTPAYIDSTLQKDLPLAEQVNPHLFTYVFDDVHVLSKPYLDGQNPTETRANKQTVCRAAKVTLKSNPALTQPYEWNTIQGHQVELFGMPHQFADISKFAKFDEQIRKASGNGGPHGLAASLDFTRQLLAKYGCRKEVNVRVPTRVNGNPGSVETKAVKVACLRLVLNTTLDTVGDVRKRAAYALAVSVKHVHLYTTNLHFAGAHSEQTTATPLVAHNLRLTDADANMKMLDPEKDDQKKFNEVYQKATTSAAANSLLIVVSMSQDDTHLHNFDMYNLKDRGIDDAARKVRSDVLWHRVDTSVFVPTPVCPPCAMRYAFVMPDSAIDFVASDMFANEGELNRLKDNLTTYDHSPPSTTYAATVPAWLQPRPLGAADQTETCVPFKLRKRDAAAFLAFQHANRLLLVGNKIVNEVTVKLCKDAAVDAAYKSEPATELEKDVRGFIRAVVQDYVKRSELASNLSGYVSRFLDERRTESQKAFWESSDRKEQVLRLRDVSSIAFDTEQSFTPGWVGTGGDAMRQIGHGEEPAERHYSMLAANREVGDIRAYKPPNWFFDSSLFDDSVRTDWLSSEDLKRFAGSFDKAVRYAKMASDWRNSSDEVKELLIKKNLDRVEGSTPRVQRSSLWSDALREISISNDRLYIFLRTLAGTLHESVEAVIEVSDASMQAEVERDRKARDDVMRRANEFANAIIKNVFETALRSAKLDFGLDGDQVMVSSSTAVDSVRRLAEGESGMSYFEAANSLQQALDGKEAHSLSSLIENVSVVLRRMRDVQLSALDDTSGDSGRASMSYLSSPRNSFTVRLKAEASAAIRTAWSTFCVEYANYGSVRPTAYEVIEGPDAVLRTTFATYCAYTMAHSRIFASSSAIYVSRNSASQNMSMLRVTLVKLCRRAQEHVRNNPTATTWRNTWGNSRRVN